MWQGKQSVLYIRKKGRRFVNQDEGSYTHATDFLPRRITDVGRTGDEMNTKTEQDGRVWNKTVTEMAAHNVAQIAQWKDRVHQFYGGKLKGIFMCALISVVIMPKAPNWNVSGRHYVISYS